MNRIVLKTNAKKVLSKNYYSALLGCFAFYFITGVFAAQISAFLTVLMFNGESTPVVEQIGFTKSHNLDSIANITTNVSVALLLAVFIVFFVGPLAVGKTKFFLHGREGSFSARSFFEVFREPYYSTALKAMLLKNVIVYLGSILIIPGIYLKYSLFFVPMIIAEDQSIEWRDALKISRRITQGHKLELLKLDLSFIGWYMISAFLLLFGIYLVHPYYEATITEAYFSLKNDFNITHKS